MTFSKKTDIISDYLKKISYSKARYAFLIISGLLTGLTLVFPEIGFFEWLTIVPTGAILMLRADDRELKLRTLYRDGLVFFYAYYLVCYHWFIYLYPLDFIPDMTKPAAIAVVIAAVFGLSLLQALMGGLLFLLTGVLFRSRLCAKLRLNAIKPFLIAGLWAIFEWTQTLGWWGVPWGRLPIGQTKYLVGIQNMEWLGSYFITFVIAAVNLIIAYMLVNPQKIKFGVLTVASLLLFQYGSGVLIWFTKDIEQGEKITVACIQGNVSSSEKWDTASLTKTFNNYSDYTREAAAEGAELVVWPETAFPYDIINGTYEVYGDYFAKLADECDIYLLVGAFTSDEIHAELNSLVCYTPNGEQLQPIYSKRRLVPFGEYVPLRPLIETLIPPLAELVLSPTDISEGEGTQIIEIKNGIGIGGLICFDSIYDGLTLASVKDGAELICLATNDSWFTDSRALNIHNAHAQLRAIESGRYVARAANTGISTAINSRGEVVQELDALVEGKIVFDAYATNRVTLWSIIGNSFVYILTALLLVLVADETIIKTKKALNNKRENQKKT